MKAETEQLLGYIERNIARTLADCTTCGKCFEACPMTQYSDQLTGKSGSAPEALEWTRLCTQSAKCIPACPENVNPMLMMRLARITSLGSTGGPAMLPDGKRDPNFFRRINAFSALQFSDAEIAEWQR
jgi:Fe-S oxidoreductase